MARYLLEQRALFQHVPRTGGSAVSGLLDDLPIRVNKWRRKQPEDLPTSHALLGHYDRRELAKVDFVFCFVRHPVAFCESVWRFMASRGPRKRRKMATNWRWHPLQQAAAEWQSDYAGWVERMLERHPGWIGRLMESYTGPEGGEHCQFIGRHETLQGDVWRVLRLLGVSFEKDYLRRSWAALGRQTASTGPNARWPAGLREKVERDERVAIWRWYGEHTVGRRRYAPLAQEPAQALAATG